MKNGRVIDYVLVVNSGESEFKAGDIVGLKEEDHNDWVIAAIRWISRLSNAKTLIGLELLIAADILKSVVVDPTLQSMLVLGGIVVIRTFLSVSLDVEINGHWPWETTRPRSSRDRRWRFP